VFIYSPDRVKDLGNHLIDILEAIPRKNWAQFSQYTRKFWEKMEYEIFSLAIYMMLDDNSWRELTKSEDEYEIGNNESSSSYSSDGKQKPKQ
jgi:hypothetical protein